MSRKANRIKLTYDGHVVNSAQIVSEPLSSVRVGTEDGLKEFKSEPVALWTAEAQESAAYLLVSQGWIVTNGVSIADKVIGRLARIKGEEVRLAFLADSADVPRPQSAREVKELMVAQMTADGATSDEIIAALLG